VAQVDYGSVERQPLEARRMGTDSDCGAQRMRNVAHSPGDQNTAPPPNESGLIKSLQKQLLERDKRIEELESQLDALKLIDQDFDKRKKPLRPPATLIPIE